MKATPSAESEFASYSTFAKINPEYTKIEYKPGGPYVKVEGYLIETGDMVYGRISYADGSSYKGFFYQGKFLSSGKFITSALYLTKCIILQRF